MSEPNQAPQDSSRPSTDTSSASSASTINPLAPDACDACELGNIIIPGGILHSCTTPSASLAHPSSSSGTYADEASPAHPPSGGLQLPVPRHRGSQGTLVPPQKPPSRFVLPEEDFSDLIHNIHIYHQEK